MSKDKKEKVPEWVKEGLKLQGKGIDRMFNDIDLANPNVREAIQKDPTLSKEQKEYVLKYGSLPKKGYQEYRTGIFITFILGGIFIAFNSVNTTGFSISNFSQATPTISGLLLFVAGLTGIYFSLKK